MTNVVPLHPKTKTETAAARRLAERLTRAAAPVTAANTAFVDELVAAMVEAIAGGVDSFAASADAIGTINDVMQDYAGAARRAHAELQRACERLEGEPS